MYKRLQPVVFFFERKFSDRSLGEPDVSAVRLTNGCGLTHLGTHRRATVAYPSAIVSSTIELVTVVCMRCFVGAYRPTLLIGHNVVYIR